MARRVEIVLFLFAVSTPLLLHARQSATSQAGSASSAGQGTQAIGPAPPQSRSSASSAASSQNPKMTEEDKLHIVRLVDGESAAVLKPIPAAKEGFRIEVGKAVDDQALKQELAHSGAAANPGDVVQVTKIDFQDKKIIIELNGGSHSHFRLRDHLQIGMATPFPTTTTTSTEPGAAPSQARGATLILDYGRPLPEIQPKEVETALASFLDFSKEHSIATNWVETLPPQYKQAIADKKAVVGMNHDMVLAAMGRPGKKVRERESDGTETEDWIYGEPPARTTFVTFVGDKVVKVEQFN